ncbi:hypothetical protein QTO34_003864 [Cnephaeus nilssonii]|uniref:Uncharacterized protein n=1 Tax=Cnephaeus nilssonii TaxID=3371016 RepID=A0AA40HRM4_CNENI|nr:hypothetical protein QTO34_003864 [Eptesicus nilssonii]
MESWLLWIEGLTGKSGRERDRELEISMREKHLSPASCTFPPTGDVPATKGHGFTRTEGRVASPGPRGAWPHPNPGPSLTRTQGRVASPGPRDATSSGPGTQPHPDPGARGLSRTQGRNLTRTRDPASPGCRVARPHPDPGCSFTRIQGHTATPGPGIQLHPDPGARGLSWTQGLTASPGPGTQPHPNPGACGLSRTRDPASPRPGTQPYPDPGVRGLAWTQGHAASPGPGTQQGFVFLIPIPVSQFPLSNSFGHFLKAPGRLPQNLLGGGLGEAPVRPVRGGGLVRGRCGGTWVCSGDQTSRRASAPGSRTQWGLVFPIPTLICQFLLSNSSGHFLKAPGQLPRNSPGSRLGEAPVRPVRGGGLVRGCCVGARVCSGGQSPGVRTWPLLGR